MVVNCVEFVTGIIKGYEPSGFRYVVVVGELVINGKSNGNNIFSTFFVVFVVLHAGIVVVVVYHNTKVRSRYNFTLLGYKHIVFAFTDNLDVERIFTCFGNYIVTFVGGELIACTIKGYLPSGFVYIVVVLELVVHSECNGNYIFGTCVFVFLILHTGIVVLVVNHNTKVGSRCFATFGRDVFKGCIPLVTIEIRFSGVPSKVGGLVLIAIVEDNLGIGLGKGVAIYIKTVHLVFGFGHCLTCPIGFRVV